MSRQQQIIYPVYQYFNPAREFTCHCGCGLLNADPYLISLLDDARAKLGMIIYITSGCRCPSHNVSVGGSPTSSHLIGKAVDIHVANPSYRNELETALRAVGFNRFGHKPGMLHTDIDPSKSPRVTFLYPPEKRMVH